MKALIARFVAWVRENWPLFLLVGSMTVAAALLALLVHALRGTL
jgi:hypothetical protein